MDTLLPVPYFLVTFTLPHTLNPLARSHQKLFYDLLFTTSADALQTLALNPEWLGGAIGMVGVLHTWDRGMGYHVHVHYLVPAGGIDPETGAWIPSHPKFLVPASALREVFRATFRDALYAADPALFAQVPPETWSKKWVGHGKAVGDGHTALKYLAPYVTRVTLSNRRLVALDEAFAASTSHPGGDHHPDVWNTSCHVWVSLCLSRLVISEQNPNKHLLRIFSLTVRHIAPIQREVGVFNRDYVPDSRHMNLYSVSALISRNI